MVLMNMRPSIFFSVCIALILIIASCKEKEKKTTATVPNINYKVKTTWEHDTQAFTEGLLIHNGLLYESTGHEKTSWIGVVDITSGKTDKKVILDEKYFGEGMCILNNKVYQLTYTTKVGFVYDLKTFKKLREFTIPSKEGWGMTHDNHHLIMSDGTDKLTYLDTTSLTVAKTMSVTDVNGPVTRLNELEYVDGFIYANVWETYNIVKIDAATGKVVGKIDATSLVQNTMLRNPDANELNGIAYHPGTKLFLVTGKYWPSIYVLQLTK
jgi:glutamine cyclotransferase